MRANDAILRLTGRKARGYRSPSWDLSPHSVELLIQHGFYYDSSMMGDDYTPYYTRRGDVIELDQPARFGARSAIGTNALPGNIPVEIEAIMKIVD